MVDQLSSFASEVTRVALEVGTEGKLGGQANVEGVAGTWKDLTDSVNMMAGNLTSQMRNIAEVATAVANGDLSRKITVHVQGEIDRQADVHGVAGTWKNLNDSVNSMASNLTNQIRNIAEVTTPVANGDLSSKIAVAVKGKIPQLDDLMITMVDQLSSFASEVT